MPESKIQTPFGALEAIRNKILLEPPSKFVAPGPPKIEDSTIKKTYLKNEPV